MNKRYHLGHIVVSGVVGTLVGMSTMLPLKIERGVEDSPKPEISETPALSILDDRAPFEVYHQVDFYDRDLDKKTVERYVVTEFGDSGADVSSRILVDLDRKNMSEHKSSVVDTIYQRCLNGNFEPSESLVINRFNN